MAKDKTYDCSKCPAYCCGCSYPEVDVSRVDCIALAVHLGLKLKEFYRAFTKKSANDLRTRILKRKKDPLGITHDKMCCTFLNVETRKCTVYEARPKICRGFPYKKHCGFYDMLSFERKHEDDPNTLPIISIK